MSATVKTIASIKRAIEGGKYRAGEPFYSVRRLADAYKVSHVTADKIITQLVKHRYLERRGHGAPFVREKIQVKPRLFGVVYNIADQKVTSHPNWIRTINALAHQLSPVNYRLQLLPLGLDGYSELVEFCKDNSDLRQVGLLLMALPFPKQDVVRFRRLNVPVVAIRAAPALVEQGWPTVTVDEGDLAFQAVDYFVKLGRKRIAAIFGPHNKPGNNPFNMVDPFLERLKCHGLSADASQYVNVTEWSAGAGAEATRKLLKQTAFDALLVVDDINAVGAINVLRQASLDVPRDVAVLGVGNLLNDHLGLELSTFDVRTQDIASKAIQLLDLACRGHDLQGQRYFFKPQLIVHSSTQPGTPMAEHSLLTTAP